MSGFFSFYDLCRYIHRNKHMIQSRTFVSKTTYSIFTLKRWPNVDSRWWIEKRRHNSSVVFGTFFVEQYQEYGEDKKARTGCVCKPVRGVARHRVTTIRRNGHAALTARRTRLRISRAPLGLPTRIFFVPVPNKEHRWCSVCDLA